MTTDPTDRDRRLDRIAGLVMAVLSIVVGVGLLVLTIGDGVVTGERGPRLGAFVDGNLLTALLFLTAGILAAAAAAGVQRRLLTLSGLLLLGGAATHLVGIAVGVDLLGGSGSTVAAFLGLGGALTVLGLTPEHPA